MPNQKSNPGCLDPMAYALSFFGGPKGVLAIAIAIVFSAVMLLWRRRKSAGLTRPLLTFEAPGAQFYSTIFHLKSRRFSMIRDVTGNAGRTSGGRYKVV